MTPLWCAEDEYGMDDYVDRVSMRQEKKETLGVEMYNRKEGMRFTESARREGGGKEAGRLKGAE